MLWADCLARGASSLRGVPLALLAPQVDLLAPWPIRLTQRKVDAPEMGDGLVPPSILMRLAIVLHQGHCTSTCW